MGRKHKAMKRLLTFALSVALTVTFIPTTMFSYAEDDNAAGAAAVEKSVAEESAPDTQKPDSVSEDTSTEATPSKEDPAVKEPVKEDPAAEKEEALTEDKPVRVKIVPVGDPEHHVFYNGEEQILKHTSENPLYRFEYYVDGKEVKESDFPDGFTASFDVLGPKKGETVNKDVEIRGTDIGSYYVTLRADLTGSAPGYYNDQEKQGFNLYLIIDPIKVTVTITGSTKEIVYDGEPHPLDMFEASCDDSSYDVKENLDWSKPEVVRNAGEYETGTSMKGYIKNRNENYNVSFEFVPGTLTIKPAPLTLHTGTDRAMAREGSEEYLECKKGWLEGLAESDRFGFEDFGGINVTSRLSLNQTETVTIPNEATIDWGKVKPGNYTVTEDFGTLTVFAEDEVQIVICGDGAYDKPVIYDTKPHAVKGYWIDQIDNPEFEKICKESGKDPICFSGKAYAEGTDVGTYPMGLTADQFSVNPEIAGVEKYKIEFIVKDGGVTIEPMPLTVTIYPNRETRDYNGEEQTMKSFGWGYPGAIEDIGYLGDYIIFDGNMEIKGTDIGVYSETLTLSKFHNLNDNYDVTFKLSSSPFSPRPLKEEAAKKAATAQAEVVEEVTSTLEIVRPTVVVKLEGKTFETTYDGKEHTLKVDAATNKAYFDGVEQEGSGFTVTSVVNKSEVPFDESKIYLRNDINLSGTDAGTYRERDWAKRLSYEDPNVAVEFASYRPMSLLINEAVAKLVVDDFEVEYDGTDIFDYARNGSLTAHYVGLPEGLEGPAYEIYFAGYVEGETFAANVAEKHILDAELLSRDSNFKVEVVPGTFTLLKRPVTVTVKGNKRVVPYMEDEKGNPITQRVDGYTLVCTDELYDCRQDVVDEGTTKPYVEGAEVDTYYMNLDDPNKFKFVNQNNLFDVTFKIEDGYLQIVDADTVIDLGKVNIVGGTYEYDGECHPATIEKPEVEVGGKTYTLKNPGITYKTKEDFYADPYDGPVETGLYNAHLDKFLVYEGDVDVTELCNWTRGEDVTVTITPRLINVQITGERAKVVLGDKDKDVVWASSATIEVTDPRSGDPDTTGYFTALNEKWLIYYSMADGVEKTSWPTLIEKATGVYPQGLDAFTFENRNPNYTIKNITIIDGSLEVVGEKEMFALPNPTPINTEYDYDGLLHNPSYAFEEQSEDKSSFEFKVGKHVYTVAVRYPKKLRLSLGYADAGVYTWYRTITSGKVVDENGYDVTALVIEPWIGSEFSGTMIIKPISASVEVKGDISKTYGDPDPDPSTWVTVESDVKAVASDIKRHLEIERVPGENVGKYQIRVFMWAEAAEDPIEPPADEAKEEAAAAEYYEDEAVEYAAKSAKASKSFAEAVEATERVRPEAEARYESEVGPGEGEIIPVIRVERAPTVERQDNISINFDDQDKFFTINRVKLTITADDNQKDYGTSDPTLTATVGKGLVGSETLPKDFYSLYRDKGEDVKVRPDFYTIHVDAPNTEVDWDAETHYFKDELVPVDPPGESARKDAEKKAYAEEAVAEKAYAAKSMKKAEALAEVLAEKEKVDVLEALEEAAYPAVEEAADWAEEEAEVEWPATEEEAEEAVKPTVASSTEFNLLNYEIVTETGKFNILGESGGDDPGDDPADEPSDDNPGATGKTSSSSSNDGGAKTGDDFGLLGMLTLSTASLIGLLALAFTRRRREQE